MTTFGECSQWERKQTGKKKQLLLPPLFSSGLKDLGGDGGDGGERIEEIGLSS